MSNYCPQCETKAKEIERLNAKLKLSNGIIVAIHEMAKLDGDTNAARYAQGIIDAIEAL